MGQIIKAICHECNFENEFHFGGGKMGCSTYRPVPALNLKTGIMESVNYVVNKENLSCLFYSNSLLKSHNDDQNTFRNFDVVLNAKNNF